ncbi:MAG TPA: DUF885 domain-containing protein [Trebonia sp.]|jgi:uncharacterized protein (DUF885 family)|nr:DUF885 domain-containing protein [Trebonia sp.]
MDATSELVVLARDYLDDLARRHPDVATELGDHRYDARLSDLTHGALDDERRALAAFAKRVAALDVAALTPEQRVDAAMLAARVELRAFELAELREHEWNPLLANPGRAVYMLLARDFAPLPDRLAAVAGRLSQVPWLLAAARSHLGAMPRVHLETAVGQFDGTIKLVSDAIDESLQDASPATIADIDRVRPAALEALAEHRDWLSARLADESAGGAGFADPRLGPERFARKLSLTLQAQADADAILRRAEDDLDRITAQITELAATLGGSPREVLRRLAADAPDGDTILRFCERALAAQTAFVREHDLITLYEDPVEVIAMPEIDRGVAVAYCDPPGPLEAGALATFIAVSPVPTGWSAERVASFYREYNRHMVQNLMIHEAMPGHYLQLGHSRRFTGSGTDVRAALWSGAFVEGWAVYTEELMAAHGYPGEGDPRAVRMQQLKMQLRMAINAILDARVHAHGLTEDAAMALMTGRGFQEEGEAAGKWRRALLTSVQLSTYYVGYTEVADLAAELLATSGATPREVHDRMLAHGSPPVGLLRTVV